MPIDSFGLYRPGLVFAYTPQTGDSGSVLSGAGSPEGVVTASVETLYWDTVGQTLYVKNSGSGNTGWVAFGSGGGGTLTTLQGSGSPEGVTTGSPGYTYFDVTNEIFYVKKTGTGNTSWKNMAGA